MTARRLPGVKAPVSSQSGGPDSVPLRSANETTADNDGVFESDHRIAAYDEIGGLTPTETLLMQRWIKSGADVLDLGVGAGRTLPTLRDRASRYVAIDYSHAMVDATSSRFPGADVRWGDAADLSEFEDGSFDAVMFSYNGLDYLAPYSRRRQALAEIRRVLRTDGVFIMSSHNPRALIRRSAHDDRSRSRRTLISAYMTLRAVASRGLSQASLRGSGYHTDHVQGLHTYFATPTQLAGELASAGYSVLDMLGGDSPVSPRTWSSPWTYVVAAPRPEGLRITRVQMPKDGTELAAAWDELASHAALGPFQSRQWVTAWNESHVDRPVVEVLAAEDSGQIVGILPIARMKRRIHRTVPIPLVYVGIAGSGWGAGDHLGPVTHSSAVASALLESLAREARRSTVLLESVDPTWAPTAQAVTGARSVASTSCPRNTRSAGGRFSDAWSAKARKNARRRDRRFAEAGITVRWTPSGPEFRDALRQLRSLHEQRWGDQGEPGLFSADRENLLMRWADLSEPPTGPWILTLVLAGKPAAAMLGLRYRDSFSVYKTGWAPAFSKYGPGIGMGQEAMRWAEEHGLHVFDYLRGDGAHKAELGCQQRHDVTMLRARGIGGALMRLREDPVHPLRRLTSAVRSKVSAS